MRPARQGGPVRAGAPGMRGPHGGPLLPRGRRSGARRCSAVRTWTQRGTWCCCARVGPTGAPSAPGIEVADSRRRQGWARPVTPNGGCLLDRPIRCAFPLASSPSWFVGGSIATVPSRRGGRHAFPLEPAGNPRTPGRPGATSRNRLVDATLPALLIHGDLCCKTMSTPTCGRPRRSRLRLPPMTGGEPASAGPGLSRRGLMNGAGQDACLSSSTPPPGTHPRWLSR